MCVHNSAARPFLRPMHIPLVAAAPDGVVFQCDPIAEGCAPDGTFGWRCSTDCIHECEMNLGAHGLRGRFPEELGEVRCAQRITQMCVGPALGAALAARMTRSYDMLQILSAIACQIASRQSKPHRSAAC
jgi:hypothetical protein